MDSRQARFVYENEIKKKQIEKLQNILDIADAVKMANACIHLPKGKGITIYNRWYRKVERRIKSIMGKKEKIQTIWDRLDRNRKSRLMN